MKEWPCFGNCSIRKVDDIDDDAVFVSDFHGPSSLASNHPTFEQSSGVLERVGSRIPQRGEYATGWIGKNLSSIRQVEEVAHDGFLGSSRCHPDDRRARDQPPWHTRQEQDSTGAREALQLETSSTTCAWLFGRVARCCRRAYAYLPIRAAVTVDSSPSDLRTVVFSCFISPTSGTVFAMNSLALLLQE